MQAENKKEYECQRVVCLTTSSVCNCDSYKTDTLGKAVLKILLVNVLSCGNAVFTSSFSELLYPDT